MWRRVLRGSLNEVSCMTDEIRMNGELIEILRSDLDSEFAELRCEMNLGFEQVNTRVAELRGEMVVRFE